MKTTIETHPEQKFGASLATWHFPATLKSPPTKILPYDKPLSNLGGGTFDAKIKVKTVIGTHPEQKFGASLAIWDCPATLKSPCTKILTYKKFLVMSMSQYFQCQNQRESSHCYPFRAKFWRIFGHLALPRNTQKSPYKNTHLSQIPCQVYERYFQLENQSENHH